MDTNTLPMSRWLDARQIAVIRASLAPIGADGGWFAANVLHRLEQAAPGTAVLFGPGMAEQRRALVAGLDWIGDLDDADAIRARLGSIDRAQLSRWATATRHVDALVNAICDALGATPDAAFDDEARIAWHALRVHATLLLIDTDRTRAAA